jgi:hypothetical protein
LNINLQFHSNKKVINETSGKYRIMPELFFTGLSDAGTRRDQSKKADWRRRHAPEANEIQASRTETKGALKETIIITGAAS